MLQIHKYANIIIIFKMFTKIIISFLIISPLINCCCWNDPLCSQYDMVGNCIACSPRSYFSWGVCTAVSGLCNTYSTVNGSCLSCYTGYMLSNGKCVISSTTSTSSQNPLCAQFDSAWKCIKCSPRSYLASNGMCIAVSGLCNTYDEWNGNCLSCYTGYMLSNGKCVLSDWTTSSTANPLCAQFNCYWQCTQCSPRSYLASNGICTAVSSLCNTYDEWNGNCLSCYAGYMLSNGKCVLQNWSSSTSNPLCLLFDSAWKCVKCSARTYLLNGICTTVSSLCDTYDEWNGKCLSCCTGYTLSNGMCIQSTSTTNPLCLMFDNNWKCIQCAARTYLNSKGICVSVNPQCNTYDAWTGDCLSCYTGYMLSNGKCVLQDWTTSSTANPLCIKFDSAWKCIQCAARAYLNSNGICVNAHPQCNTYDAWTGSCLSCYTGYMLSNGDCIISVHTTNNPFCLNYDSSWKCTQCAARTYFDANGICVYVNPLCNTYNVWNGKCLSCYAGYQLSYGNCIVAIPPTVNNPLCLKFNMYKQCIQCSARTYFAPNGVCTYVNPACATYDVYNGICWSCYPGYYLNNGVC